MSWEYEYDESTDETTIYWVGDSGTKTATINGQIKSKLNGIPSEDPAKSAIESMVQASGTPERIQMQYDLHFGFDERV